MGWSIYCVSPSGRESTQLTEVCSRNPQQNLSFGFSCTRKKFVFGIGNLIFLAPDCASLSGKEGPQCARKILKLGIWIFLVFFMHWKRIGLLNLLLLLLCRPIMKREHLLRSVCGILSKTLSFFLVHQEKFCNWNLESRAFAPDCASPWGKESPCRILSKMLSGSSCPGKNSVFGIYNVIDKNTLCQITYGHWTTLYVKSPIKTTLQIFTGNGKYSVIGISNLLLRAIFLSQNP